MVPFNYATGNAPTHSIIDITEEEIEEKESIQGSLPSESTHSTTTTKPYPDFPFGSPDGFNINEESNWILLCKRKLKVHIRPTVNCIYYGLNDNAYGQEREEKLIRHRLREGSRLIQQSISQFTQQNKRFFIDLKKKTTIRVGRMDTVNHQIYETYLPPLTMDRMAANSNVAISALLDEWDGSVPSSEPLDLSTFPLYFAAARKWFDDARTYLLTEHLWIPLLSLTEMVQNMSSLFIYSISCTYQQLEPQWTFLIAVHWKLWKFHILNLQNVNCNVYRSRVMQPRGSFTADLSIYNVNTESISIC